MEEKYEIIRKAMTELDGIEACLMQIWPADKPIPAHGGSDDYWLWVIVRAGFVHISDLRFDLDGVLSYV